MKAKALLVLFFNFCFFHYLHAQNERLDDLVPYKKAGKWGLVHHDGTEFYPPVFDSLKIEFDPTFFWGEHLYLFPVNYTGDRLLEVIYKKQKYFLTPGKKLISYAAYMAKIKKTPFIAPQILRDTEIFDEKNKTSKQMPESPPPTIVENRLADNETELKSVSGKLILIREEKNEYWQQHYKFYINGTYKPEFDCNSYNLSKKEKRREVYSGAVADNGKGKGYIDFEKEQVTVPFEYIFLDFNDQWDNWLIDPIKGIVNKDGKKVGRTFYRIRKMEFEYQIPVKSVVVKTVESKYHFYYPEQDSLGFEEYEYLDEFYCNFSQFNPREAYFIAEMNGKFGLLNNEQKVILPFNFTRLKCLGDVPIVIEKDGKSGLIDTKNNWFTIEPTFDNIMYIFMTDYKVNGLPYFLIYVERNGQTFYIDNFGKEFISK